MERSFKCGLRTMFRIEQVDWEVRMRFLDCTLLSFPAKVGNVIVGFLVHHIATSPIIYNQENEGFRESQVECLTNRGARIHDMLQELHAHGLVRGNVNPSNIDENVDA